MTILGELRAEVLKALRRNASRILLWPDPQHEGGRLLDQLATIVSDQLQLGSQLELCLKIEVEPAQKPRIVYVPLARQVLSAL